MTILKPPRLKRGDVIGLIAPASAPSDSRKVELAVRYLEKLRYRVEVAEHVGARHGYFAGTDEQRVADLNAMLNDPKVKAIFAVRGGYGTPRLLPFVDYAAITADRFVHFFAFLSASFSARHNVTGAAFYGALYLLAIVAVIAATRRDGAAAEVVILSAMIVLAVAFWHSLVVIDFDWRYRLPILPHLI